MRAIVTADLHLGFGQFPAAENGRNARSQDVERAWARAVDIIVTEQPDAVLIGGDVFHSPRVGNYAVKAWRDGIRRIVTETQAYVIVVVGNHDVARTREVLTPVVIPDDLPRFILVTEPKRVRFRAPVSHEWVSVACFPFVALGADQEYSLEPDPEADVNAVLMHAAVKTTEDGEALPYFYGGAGAIDVGREAGRWDLIACGDYHTFTRLHPTALALYPGSIERTSSDIWHEPEEKGVALCDTATGELRFIEIPTRPVRDFFTPPHRAPLTAADLNDELAHLLRDPDMMSGAIVRYRPVLASPAEKVGVDHQLLRALKQACLHFHFQPIYAAAAGAGEDAAGNREARGGRTLIDDAREYFAGEPDDVRAVCLRALEEAA